MQLRCGAGALGGTELRPSPSVSGAGREGALAQGKGDPRSPKGEGEPRGGAFWREENDFRRRDGGGGISSEHNFARAEFRRTCDFGAGPSDAGSVV